MKQSQKLRFGGENESFSLDKTPKIWYNRNRFHGAVEKMSKKKRMVFGVVGAEVNSIEQREILKGVISQAQSCNIDIVVISNIYNTSNYNADVNCENQIYDLILSPEFDALIVLSESFVNEELQQNICQLLLQQTVPVLIVGSRLQNLDHPNFRYINTSDENDIEDITNHLIEEHGFTDIDILTGYDFIDISHYRVNGYRKALESHGIEFDEKKVYYGDFWMNSGQALAKRYINGELPYPQAIVCANDYMAYGLIDELLEHHVVLPDRMTVIGYEYVCERFLHSPLLTTYQRNREKLGESAVQILYGVLQGDPKPAFTPPKGKIIFGTSCTCGKYRMQLHEELKNARIKKQYDTWNLFNQMEQKLTVSTTLEELIKIIGDFQFLVRYVQNIYLCLYEHWFDCTPDIPDEFITCRSVIPWMDQTPIVMQRLHFSEMFADSDIPSAYYFSPLFFNGHMFGHIVLKYEKPDTYDDVFRNWMKSVSNGLEFLRMKNDIQYLLQCRNLSEHHDTMLNMYNENGLRNAFQSMMASTKETNVYVLMLRVCLNRSDNFSETAKKHKIKALLNAADAVKNCCHSSGICGRMGENTFLCFIKHDAATADMIADKCTNMMLFSEDYMERYDLDSFCCAAALMPEGCTYTQAEELVTQLLEDKIHEITVRRTHPHYSALLSIRQQIYKQPQSVFSLEELGKQQFLSTNYLRKIYKDCFGTSFHQECINVRVSMARHLLLTTSMNISAIAEKCGYDDSKYFMRQFVAATDCTPSQYRKLLG